MSQCFGSQDQTDQSSLFTPRTFVCTFFLADKKAPVPGSYAGAAACHPRWRDRGCFLGLRLRRRFDDVFDGLSTTNAVSTCTDSHFFHSSAGRSVCCSCPTQSDFESSAALERCAGAALNPARLTPRHCSMHSSFDSTTFPLLCLAFSATGP